VYVILCIPKVMVEFKLLDCWNKTRCSSDVTDLHFFFLRICEAQHLQCLKSQHSTPVSYHIFHKGKLSLCLNNHTLCHEDISHSWRWAVNFIPQSLYTSGERAPLYPSGWALELDSTPSPWPTSLQPIATPTVLSHSMFNMFLLCNCDV
jgi:hypothetical protein